MLLCIRCGACLNTCPVYRTVGGHAYESVYPGPMGAVLSNLLGRNLLEHSELPHLSTLCDACRDVCPARIDLPRLLRALRRRAQKPLLHQALALGWGTVMKSSTRFELAGRLARSMAGWSPRPLPGGWLRENQPSFRDRWKAHPENPSAAPEASSPDRQTSLPKRKHDPSESRHE